MINDTGSVRLHFTLAWHERFVITDSNVEWHIALIADKRLVKRTVGIKISMISFPIIEFTSGLIQSF